MALTRAVNQLTLYTDDKEALLKAVMNNPGDKSSALEIMGEASPRAAFHLQSSVCPTTPGCTSGSWTQRDLQADRHPPAELSGESRQNEFLTPAPEAGKPAPPRLDAQRISHLLTDQAEAGVRAFVGRT